MTLSALRTVLTCLHNKELARILISVYVNAYYIWNNTGQDLGVDTLWKIMSNSKKCVTSSSNILSKNDTLCIVQNENKNEGKRKYTHQAL